MVVTAILGALAAAAAIVIALNFSSGEKKIERRIAPLYAVSDPQFLRSMGSLLGPAVVDGNHVVTLANGDEIFPSMLETLRSAQKTITFETYIYWSGTIGKQFAEALANRARAKVRVHVLLDWLGSGKLDREVIAEMEAAGVEVRKYHPLRWYNLARMNNRTHRKLLVVDGNFVPDDLSVETLVAARRRGVRIDIVVPGPKIDAEISRKASRSRWGDLLRAGVTIHEYQPTMFHCKVMIVDDVWVSVGSTNFDNRSFRLNDEVNLNVFDRHFAAVQVLAFDADKAQSTRITLEAWERRPFREKVLENAAGLLRSQL